MIFKVINNKLYETNIITNDTIEINKLPFIETYLPTKLFYKYDSNKNIIIDEERTLEFYKNIVISFLNSKRDQELLNGFIWNNHKFILNDLTIKALQTKAIQVIMNLYETYTIIDADNNTLNLTKEEMQDLIKKSSEFADSIFIKYRKIKDSILECNSIECIDNIIKENNDYSI